MFVNSTIATEDGSLSLKKETVKFIIDKFSSATPSSEFKTLMDSKIEGGNIPDDLMLLFHSGRKPKKLKKNKTETPYFDTSKYEERIEGIRTRIKEYHTFVKGKGTKNLIPSSCALESVDFDQKKWHSVVEDSLDKIREYSSMGVISLLMRFMLVVKDGKVFYWPVVGREVNNREIECRHLLKNSDSIHHEYTKVKNATLDNQTFQIMPYKICENATSTHDSDYMRSNRICSLTKVVNNVDTNLFRSDSCHAEPNDLAEVKKLCSKIGDCEADIFDEIINTLSNDNQKHLFLLSTFFGLIYDCFNKLKTEKDYEELLLWLIHIHTTDCPNVRADLLGNRAAMPKCFNSMYGMIRLLIWSLSSCSISLNDGQKVCFCNQLNFCLPVI